MHQINVLYQSEHYTIYSIQYNQIDSKSKGVRFSQEKDALNFLLENVLGSHVGIRRLSSGRPILENANQFISISHSSSRVVVQLSTLANPGIDTEHFRPQLKQVASKFLSEEEKIVCEQKDMLKLLCLYWSAKEAIYKSADIAGLSFAQHIRVENIAFSSDSEGYIYALLSTPTIRRSYQLRFFLPSHDEAVVFVDQITEQV